LQQISAIFLIAAYARIYWAKPIKYLKNMLKESVFSSSPVPSPCISVCEMNARTALCTGCQRTIEEIAAWGLLGDAEKRAVWLRIATRRKTAESYQKP
jgi:uncharacterized protein